MTTLLVLGFPYPTTAVAAAEEVALWEPDLGAEAEVEISAAGIADADIQAIFARMPAAGFERGRPAQVAWQAEALRGVGQGATLVLARR